MSSIRFTYHSNELTHEQCTDVGHIFSHAHSKQNNHKNQCPDKHRKAKEIKSLTKTASANFIFAYQEIGPGQQKLCAFLCFEKKESEHYIHDVCVLPQGLGIGATMMTMTFAKAREDRIKQISLEPTNSSQAFYENLLFTSYVCPEKEQIMMKNTDIEETYQYLDMIYNKPKL